MMDIQMGWRLRVVWCQEEMKMGGRLLSGRRAQHSMGLEPEKFSSVTLSLGGSWQFSLRPQSYE